MLVLLVGEVGIDHVVGGLVAFLLLARSAGGGIGLRVGAHRGGLGGQVLEAADYLAELVDVV